MAVQQHFIHVLMLKCWNADDVSQGIMAIDEIDLPNVMRIVDLLISTGNVPNIGHNLQSQIDQMPIPGDTFLKLFSAGRFFEKQLSSALIAAKEMSLSTGSCDRVSRLLDNPLSARANFEHWMKSQEEKGYLKTNHKHNLLIPRL